ncbi:DUF2846 domain-containing protein [Novosphingobium guangzhouense]|uniref:DUF2846 domain-containing protein n=1 Tax=Novosphingobium guangzhouense TaxID=1850347 RepID=A0A2K2G1Z6_9SPHN|nr:DUF2846 domain-containing protein [Novosphingobium guangzhouense]PNU05057.1 hypothetical protein A8V01_04290 [Novosphingobium guangzhouense]
MMRKIPVSLTILAAAALAPVGGPALAAEDSAPVAIPAPPAGKGQIVFYRTGTIMGAAMGCAVNENGQKISSLGSGRYFVLVTEPGRHEYTVKSEAKDVLALEVEADETQYAMCRIKMGIMAGRPDLRPSTRDEFVKSGTDRIVDAEDMGPAPGALRPEELKAAVAATPTPAEVTGEAAAAS